MYLHGQIHQSQGLSQIRRITVFELAGLGRACQGPGSLRSQYGSLWVGVCVCVAAGLPGFAASRTEHLHTQHLKPTSPFV